MHSAYTIKKKLQSLFDLICVSNAAVSSGYKYNSNYLKILGTGYFMAYYFFNSKRANLEVKKSSFNPKFEVAQRVWNLLDTNVIKQVYTKSLPGVAYRKRLFFKRQSPEITLQLISNLIDNIRSKGFSVVNENIINTHYNDENMLTINNVEEEGDLFKAFVDNEESKSNNNNIYIY